jgi:hypothetical protein
MPVSNTKDLQTTLIPKSSMLVRGPLLAGAFAVPAPGPAAGAALAFFQLLLGPPNAALPGRLLLGILDPADELVAGERRDVLPGIQCRGIGDQRLLQVSGQLVHDSTGHSLAGHGLIVFETGIPTSERRR